MEYAKALTDKINAWHSKGALEVDDFTRTTPSMHFYDSIVVFEKDAVTKPKSLRSGDRTINQRN